MLSLSNSERFQNDMKTYTRKISQIKDLKIKESAQKLLAKIKQECRFIDEKHNTDINGYVDPKQNRANLERLYEYRKSLNSILKDY